MMSDDRQERDFSARSVDEQKAFLEQTWCDECQQANLGMSNQREYLFKGIIFVEGDCNGCGHPVLTELTEEDF